MCKIISAALSVAFVLLFAGCGSLSQSVGGPKMPNSAMEFAKQMPAGGSSFSITYNYNELTTKTWASKVYPVFPVIYWSTLGNFNPTPNYGVRSSTIIFPVFFVVRDSVYDEKGLRINSESRFNLAFVLGYEDKMTPKSSDFRIGLLWIPGIGPFFGAGPEFFQFLWIPFTDFR